MDSNNVQALLCRIAMLEAAVADLITSAPKERRPIIQGLECMDAEFKRVGMKRHPHSLLTLLQDQLAEEAEAQSKPEH